MSACRAIVALSLLVVVAPMGGFSAGGDLQSGQLIEWIQRLDSGSYHSRRDAAERLMESANLPDKRADTRRALHDGLAHPSLEVRLACQAILQRMDQVETDRQLEMLLNPTVVAERIELPSWRVASQLLGDDMAARVRFASLVRNYPLQTRVLDTRADHKQRRRTLAQLDPYRLAPEETDQWTLLLMLELVCDRDPTRKSAARSSMCLSSSQLGPKPQNPQDRVLFRRLIDQWVDVHEHHCPARERMLISMKYECTNRVRQIAAQVLGNRSAPPATQVMAMLCGSAIELPERSTWLVQRLDDDRTAHVWQMIASRKARIQTQVRDVALALLLHEHGIDPRKVGFDELQADPILVFREHSLGFADDHSRQLSHQKGLKRIADRDRIDVAPVLPGTQNPTAVEGE